MNAYLITGAGSDIGLAILTGLGHLVPLRLDVGDAAQVAAAPKRRAADGEPAARRAWAHAGMTRTCRTTQRKPEPEGAFSTRIDVAACAAALSERHSPSRALPGSSAIKS